MWADVKKKIPTYATYEVFRVRDNIETGSPPAGYTVAQIEDHVNNKTWGPQANVFIDVLRIVDPAPIDYDKIPANGLDTSASGAFTLEMTTARSTSSGNRQANVQIYFVTKFDGSVNATGITFDGNNSIFMDNSNKTLPVMAHEIGHSFHTEEEHSTANQSEDVKITITYEPSEIGQPNVSRDYNFKVYNLEIQQNAAFSGFDDNSEAYGGSPFPGLMVPLSGNDGTSGTNKFKIITKPADLASKFQISMVNAPLGNISVNHTGPLNSGTKVITVTGTKHVLESNADAGNGPIIEVKTTSGQKLAASLFVDVKKKLSQAGTYDIFKIKDDTDTGHPAGYSAAVIKDYVNNQTWGPQANVFINTINDMNIPAFNWDHEADGLEPENIAEENRISNGAASQASAITQIFFVDRFKSGSTALAYHKFNTSLKTTGRIFVDETKKSLKGVGHEIGHSFGLNSDFGLGGHSNSFADLMGGYLASSSQENKQIRRIDWNTANQ